jgi:CRP/FNR family transcriptional regulator, cyclic AMP receptor protein
MEIAMQPVSLEPRDYATPADWADILAPFPLFAGTGKRRLRELVRHATFAEYVRGDVVIKRGGSGDSLYVVLSGSARALGKPAARTLRSGDYFGELGALDGVPRSATIVATGELHVMRLPREPFLRLARRDPTIPFKLLGNLGSQIRRLETLPARG